MAETHRVAAVCVYVTSSSHAPQRYLDLAAEVGTLIAARGHSLVSGGGDVSGMGAVARAARAGGARTVGVIPELLLRAEVGDRDSDELVVVTDMRARKGEMERRADAFLALPGGLGTLEELLEVWVARTLGFHAKPVVALDPDGVYAPLRQQVAHLVDLGLVRPAAAASLRWAGRAEQALDLLEAGLGSVAPQPVTEELLEAGP